MNNAPSIGYAPGWIEAKLCQPRAHLTSMTRPISPDSPFWNILERITRVMAVTFIPWAAWITVNQTQHARLIDREIEWRRGHEDFARSRVEQIERIDREVQEWRVRMAAFSEETRAGIRATDVSVRDVGARLGVMADTTSRIQEGLAAIREKMVNLQVVTDALNDKGNKP